jgi:hypothetical protein
MVPPQILSDINPGNDVLCNMLEMEKEELIKELNKFPYRDPEEDEH